MRKFFMIALAASVALPTMAAPTTASAQSAREVRDSAREVRRDQRDLRQAQRYGDRRDVRDARRNLNDSRRELREDWRDYRRSNRQAFHRPAYVGPRGYAYRPVAVGHRFDRAYYGDRYVVRDYARYRLPAPRAGHRWIRYNNDVVMVNPRSGRVVQVYNGFFW
ncbi:RcnB family protein [Novosphingobium gossypii]|uniref:RcnB family protein n=1 Tax=Novosphingobium gossypii TaxID=1604774 RepID=UPI003D1DD342